MVSENSITIVYDNKLHDKGLKSGWGFSCLVEYSGKKILFDTGDNAGRLSFNLDALNINPRMIDALVLSHNHWDHTGGLEAVIGKNNNLELFFGKSFPEDFKQGLRNKGIKFSPVGKMTDIAQGIYVGPEMEALGPREIPLTVKTNLGLVIITGCAHPGITKMVKRVKETLGKKIYPVRSRSPKMIVPSKVGVSKGVYLVLGGFHLEGTLRLGEIISELKEMRVEKAAPCHCTGEGAIEAFRESFQGNFIEVGAGLQIPLGQ